MKNYIHQIVTKTNRTVTRTETIITNDNKPKTSMKMYLKILAGVQYEIVDRTTNEIVIVGKS
jgi:hypothetical protein